MPFIVVGTQIDLRDDIKLLNQTGRSNKQRLVTYEQTERLVKDFKVKYVECSSLTQQGLKDVFDEAIVTALEPPEVKKRRRLCNFL